METRLFKGFQKLLREWGGGGLVSSDHQCENCSTRISNDSSDCKDVMSSTFPTLLARILTSAPTSPPSHENTAGVKGLVGKVPCIFLLHASLLTISNTLSTHNKLFHKLFHYIMLHYISSICIKIVPN